MIELTIVSFITSLIFNSNNAIMVFIKSYGYLAIFLLMLLEASSLPVPSEVVLPLAGYFVYEKLLNFPLAFAAALAGAIIGSLIDYMIGYVIGKEVVYKHLGIFHIKKEQLDNFDVWFTKNGVAAVFMTRLVPVARTFINFPAGFAKMPLKEFLAYSIAGMVIWDLVLMLFGYYVGLSVHSVVLILAAIGVFLIALYLIYKFAMKKMKK